jgi:hypothetical protein
MADPAQSPRERAGRRVALVLIWALAVALGLIPAASITFQVFAPEGGPKYASCTAGLAALSAAVDRARTTAASGEGAEDEALSRFRAALQPDWSGVDGVAMSCRGKPEDEGALDALERLRYAEEHAVRRESGDLAPLRREVRRKVPQAEASPPPSAPSSRP